MEKWNDDKKNSSTWAGLFLLAFGTVFLLKNIGLDFPGWLFSWHTILVIIGLFVGYKRNFEGKGWLVLVLIGGYFTLRDILDEDITRYYFAAALIVMGLFLIFKPKSSRIKGEKWKKKQANFSETTFAATEEPISGYEGADGNPVDPKMGNWVDENDIIDAVCVFGGTDQHVYSKNFKGGDLVAVFGGCNVNLTQADFEGAIVLEVVAVFGGVKIIIPSSWIVKSEVTAVFGGIEDKRGPVVLSDGGNKIIKITGLALFGGVEIRNF
ncbi:LiaF transmembrane domain-containing protein [Pedobacter gandavensis]|uniref:LiaF transmembrane domain-containing protein n=1 Tax=Pedobacter gandavensis TaxID=2679963 RepID=UPI002930F5CD|nr:LiaF domain-containing protein [Pedobacter gandavensis]